MAEETVVRGINWKDTFPFTLIFRSFRIAIHPSKLVLALLALLAIYCGGRLLDAVWPERHNGVRDEVAVYEAAQRRPDPGVTFRAVRKAERDDVEARYRRRLEDLKKPDGDLGDIKKDIVQRRDREAQAARADFDAERQRSNPNADTLRTMSDARDQRILGIYRGAYEEYRSFKEYQGVGLFRLFYDYELGQVNMIVRAAREWNWMGP